MGNACSSNSPKRNNDNNNNNNNEDSTWASIHAGLNVSYSSSALFNQHNNNKGSSTIFSSIDDDDYPATQSLSQHQQQLVGAGNTTPPRRSFLFSLTSSPITSRAHRLNSNSNPDLIPTPGLANSTTANTTPTSSTSNILNAQQRRPSMALNGHVGRPLVLLPPPDQIKPFLLMSPIRPSTTFTTAAAAGNNFNNPDYNNNNSNSRLSPRLSIELGSNLPIRILSLKTILTDSRLHLLRQDLREELSTQHASETLDFLTCLHTLKTLLVDSGGNNIDIDNTIEDSTVAYQYSCYIMERFVVDGAIQQVCIGDTMRQPLLQAWYNKSSHQIISLLVALSDSNKLLADLALNPIVSRYIQASFEEGVVGFENPYDEYNNDNYDSDDGDDDQQQLQQQQIALC
jgi:hypothetical protein